MTPQKNTYKVVEDVAQLLCENNKGEVYAAVFPSVYVDIVRSVHWAYKGKTGIWNSTLGTLAGVLAKCYGYEPNTWVRIDSNENFFKSNYKERTPSIDIAKYAGAWVPEEVPYFSRVKWRTKYECETLECDVLRFRVATGEKVKIKINKYLRSLVPTGVYIRPLVSGRPDIVCPNGTPLRIKILAYALDLSEDELGSYRYETNRPDMYDFRIDPNDNSYISTNATIQRAHRVEDGVIVEIRERATSDTHNWAWGPGDPADQFRIPIHGTKYAERGCFVKVDAKVYEQINKIWYSSITKQFMVDDLLTDKPRALKYLVCDVAGIKYKDVYFAPRLTESYRKALDGSDGTGNKHDRRRAKYENRIATGEGDGRKRTMFTKPRYVKRARLKFDAIRMDETLYGGVGIFYLDCRADALQMGASTDPRQDKRNRKKETDGTSSIY